VDLARWEAGNPDPQRIRELPVILEDCHSPSSRFYSGLLKCCSCFDGTKDCIQTRE
jgi:hypothetical protein